MTGAATPDPGWGVTKFSFWLILFPGGMRQIARKNGPNANGLLPLRQVYLSFVSAGVLVGVVTVLLVRGQDADAPALWIAITAVVGITALIAVRRFAPRLDCANAGVLANSYRTRMFIRMAFGEAAPVAGFVCGLASGIWWMYFVGLVFAVPVFWWAAPSARNVSADERRLAERGCATNDIVAAFQPGPT